jgi:hypothetical protein
MDFLLEETVHGQPNRRNRHLVGPVRFRPWSRLCRRRRGIEERLCSLISAAVIGSEEPASQRGMCRNDDGSFAASGLLRQTQQLNRLDIERIGEPAD